MPARGTLFLNRSSGVKLPPEEISALIEATGEAGLEVIEIGGDLDIAGAVRERIDRGMRRFVAAGGDGTVHYVVQAIVNTEASLAVIPTGTYNHFARDLDIPLDWREALKVAIDGEVRQVDTGRINDRFFVNNVSLGLYPELVSRREAHGRDYPRWKARLYAFYGTIRKYKHVTLAIETEVLHEVIRTHVFMVSNNSYDLERVGIEAPRATLTGGRLSVYWLQHTSRLRLTRMIARYMTGRVRHIPGFRSFRTLRMAVQSPRRQLRVGIDGEVVTLDTPLMITIVPRSLNVRVPPKEAAS